MYMQTDTHTNTYTLMLAHTHHLCTNPQIFLSSYTALPVLLCALTRSSGLVSSQYTGWTVQCAYMYRDAKHLDVYSNRAMYQSFLGHKRWL